MTFHLCRSVQYKSNILANLYFLCLNLNALHDSRGLSTVIVEFELSVHLSAARRHQCKIAEVVSWKSWPQVRTMKGSLSVLSSLIEVSDLDIRLCDVSWWQCVVAVWYSLFFSVSWWLSLSQRDRFPSVFIWSELSLHLAVISWSQVLLVLPTLASLWTLAVPALIAWKTSAARGHGFHPRWGLSEEHTFGWHSETSESWPQTLTTAAPFCHWRESAAF